MRDVSNVKVVGSLDFGFGALEKLSGLLDQKVKNSSDYVVFFIDQFFKNKLSGLINIRTDDLVYFVDSSEEPTTEQVDFYHDEINTKKSNQPCAVVGVGGGTTLDITKAVSNLLGNRGRAADYQGWDLLKKPGVFKIGIPTLSGTGAEASRTCVLINKDKNIKLGMNSEFTLFDHLILDPSLTKTVERNQYFYTAMDTYIHCVESLRGSYRNIFADRFSHQSLELVREIMLSDDMMSDENREKLMLASYLGGSAIGNSFVGVVHPISAGLSTVFGTHHCVGNCIVMQKMAEFYPTETEEFLMMVDKQGVSIPSNVCSNLTDEVFNRLYDSSIVHEKPLINALGKKFKEILNKEKVLSLYESM